MRCNRKIIEDDRGFTLVELIVTVVILALIAAPFLSSFVSASKTNVKSKRVQEANELSQLIIEEFKVSSLAKLGTYGLHEDASGNYTGTIDASTVSSVGYSNNYTVDVVVKPSTTKVNSDEAIPVIDKLDRTECLVLVDNLTKFSVGSAYKRKIKVDINYNAGKFPIKVTIQACDVSDNVLSTNELNWEYNKVPSIYMLYEPLSHDDEIVVNNNIDYATYKSDAGVADVSELNKVNVYIMNQDSGTVLQAAKISFTEYGDVTPKQLDALYNKDSSKILNETVVYTNLVDKTGSGVSSGSSLWDNSDTVNRTIKKTTSVTVYDMDLDVKYAGSKIYSYSASKMLEN